MNTTAASTLPNVTKEVAQKFHSLRFKYLAARVASVVLGAMGAGLLLWLILAIIDYYWEIHITGRQAMMRGGIGIACAVAITLIVRHAKNSAVRAFVSRIERAFESFGQRIRTVLDAVDGKISGPPEMLAALGHQTLGRWDTLVPSQIVPRTLLMACAGFFVSTATLVVVSMLGQGEWKSAMMRSLGYDIPYTSLSVEPGNFSVLEGTPVHVQLSLIGRQNRDVELQYRLIAPETLPLHKENSTEGTGADRTNWVSHKLKANDQGLFAFEFGQARDPIEYKFVTSVGTTEVYRIQVKPRIVATRIETHVTPPDYTKLEPRVFSSAEATVLEQSAVSVHVETNYPLSSVQLEIGPKSSNLAPHTARIESTGTTISFDLPTTTSLHWKLNAVGRDETPMTTISGRLRVREDVAPSIRWQDPPDEIRVHTLAELPMRVHVSDDYGITETGIMFRVGDDEEFELAKRSTDQLQDDSSIFATSVLLDEILPLESFALSERDYVSYYAYAIDNRHWGPQRVETDVRYIDIRPLRQFFREIDPVAGDSGGRLLVQLDEIIRRERHLIRRTNKLEKQGAKELSHQIKTIDIMVEAQSELAGLTRFLAEFFVRLGSDDVEALSQAETSMLQAADSLSAVSLPLALSQEEDALRYLAEARRTIEILLSKTTSAQQSQMAQFARQLQQKLRREVKQTEQQLADSLEQIATEQRQIAEQFSGSDSQGEAKRNEEQFQKQVELLERVEAIEDQLKARLERSKLMASRMKEAKQDMSELAEMAKAGQCQICSEKGLDASDQLNEIAMQLRALGSSEAVNRVALLRDMTLSMAERERDLADAVQQGHANAMSDDLQTPKVGVSSSQSANRLTENMPLLAALRLSRRATTLADVWSAPVDTGDVAMGEYMETLDKVTKENQLADRLNQSQQVGEHFRDKFSAETKAKQTDRGDELGNPKLSTDQQAPGTEVFRSDQAIERARDYIDAAGQIDLVYRQLVSPRVERLRELEQQATQLQQTMAARGGKSEGAARSQSGSGLVEKLQRDLRQEGMSELADLLDRSAEEPQVANPSRYVWGGNPTLQNQVEVIVRELRQLIQEMILLEAASDRDMPVPSIYRAAVDGYFRAIAGENDE